MLARIWGPAGPTGSIANEAKSEVRAHLKRNLTARQVRYSRGHRLMRLLLTATFGILLVRYLILDLAMINLEGLRGLFPSEAFELSRANAAQANELIDTLPALLLTVQVGLLTIISLALALVTLIAQREDATTDIKVYYHEAMFFGMAASGVALVVVLVVQLFWPLQSLYRFLSGSHPSAAFDFVLVTAHAAWLVVNLCGAAHFIAVTFDFVQPTARKRLRERYTANAVMPYQLAETLRRVIYLNANGSPQSSEPQAVFGMPFRSGGKAELKRDFVESAKLVDVHMRYVRWVIKRWAARCSTQEDSDPLQIQAGPRLIFTPVPGRILVGEVAWCLRKGGVPLTKFERWLLRRAFQFKGNANDG